MSSYYKRHPELMDQAKDDKYGKDRNQLLAAFRQYYTSKQPDYLPDEVRAEAAEQYLKYLYDLSNEQLYDRLQDLLGDDEEAAYYQSLIQDPNFDADKQLDDDEGYQNYIKKQLAQNESPGSVYMAGTAFAVGIMKAMGPKYSTEGEHFTRVNGKKALRPNFQYTTEEGYTYTTDEKGRIKSVEADLQVGDGKRNPYAQRKAGGEDRNPDDDGGHLIASMFKGSGDLDNLVPMNSQVNRAGGKWYEMEQEWKQALTGEPPQTCPGQHRACVRR